jgi:hypothetical protein
VGKRHQVASHCVHYNRNRLVIRHSIRGNWSGSKHKQILYDPHRVFDFFFLSFIKLSFLFTVLVLDRSQLLEGKDHRFFFSFVFQQKRNLALDNRGVSVVLADTRALPCFLPAPIPLEHGEHHSR